MKARSTIYRQLALVLAVTVLTVPANAKSSKKKAPAKAAPVAKKAPASVVETKKSTSLDELKLVEGDEKGNEVKSLKAELMVSKAEQNAIAQAMKLLKKHKGTELEPEIQFRLAELYMRKSKTDRFFEVHRESETIVKLAPRATQSASSRQSVKQAVETYKMIQTKWKDFPQMDVVVFNHAFASQVIGNEKEAESLYLQLVSKYQGSPLVPDSYLALGEIAFNRAQFPQALEKFNAIKNYPKSRVYPYGLYKAAWTYYNMRDAEKGLKKLEEVVAFGRMVAEKGIDARLDLRKEALNDMTLFFEDVYPSKSAFDYFTQQAGESEAGPILLRMGNLYERHSRFADQRTVLDRFVKEMPTSPLRPKVQNDLILAHDHLREKDKAVDRLGQMAQLCSADGEWARAQAKKKEDVAKVSGECLAFLNETSSRLAKKWLKAWKKLPSDTTYADASEKAFEIYLKTPAATDEYRESRYAYAELLFARQKYRKASAEYAAIGASAPAGELGHNASYAAVLSLEKAVGEKWSNEDEKSFHQLAQAYVTKNPKGQYRLDIEYKMALLAYEKERYDEAAPTFLRLGRDFPNQEKGQKSQDLYLDILNIKKDYAGVRNYAQELIKVNSGDPSRESKMRKLYETAYFLQVQSLEEKQQYKEALAEYAAFAKANPNSELTEKAMWNAMQLYIKTGDGWNAAKMGVEFADKYSKSDKAINALLSAAQTFEQMGQLSEAASVLEKLAIREPKNANRWKELAADFHALDGESVAARRMYEELKTVGNQEQRTKILNKLEALEKSYGTAASQAAMQKMLIDMNIQPHANNAKVALVEKAFEKGRYDEAFQDAKRLNGGSMTPNQRARLRLVTAKILEQEFMKASVKSRAERVGTVLAIKTEKLNKAQEAFQAAIKYGDARVSVESFERLYGLYSSYVKALKEMSPSGLNADDAKAFRAEIDNLVIPLEEKSIDTLAQAVKFARSQAFLDGTAARLESELNKLNQQVNPNLLPEVEKPDIALPVLAGVNP